MTTKTPHWRDSIPLARTERDRIFPEARLPPPNQILSAPSPSQPREAPPPRPFEIPERIRTEHTHVLAGTGHGKTNLLATQFLSDLNKKPAPAIIIIDGKGTFVQQLQRLRSVYDQADRVVILNPQDHDFPPALNVFALPRRTAMLPSDVLRKVQENVISNFQYIFGTKDFGLTQKQATCLSYCVRLLFAYKPVATIETLLDLLAEKSTKTGEPPPNSKFQPFIATQSPIARRFFSHSYYSTEYGETKNQIQNRIYDLLSHPAFYAMFSATELKLDLFDIIQNRKILLVDSSSDALGDLGAPVLGRYIIAQALAAAYARMALPRDQWHPAYLIVDEAQMFVDEEKTQPLLQQAREFNLGVTLAHQKLDDLTPKLVATIASNTSTKFAGGISAQDAVHMAKNMRCSPEFLSGLAKTGDEETSFGCFVRGHTPQAVAVSYPLRILLRQNQITDAEDHGFMARNGQKISAGRPTQPPEPEPPGESAASKTDSKTSDRLRGKKPW